MQHVVSFISQQSIIINFNKEFKNVNYLSKMSVRYDILHNIVKSTVYRRKLLTHIFLTFFFTDCIPKLFLFSLRKHTLERTLKVNYLIIIESICLKI